MQDTLVEGDAHDALGDNNHLDNVESHNILKNNKTQGHDIMIDKYAHMPAADNAKMVPDVIQAAHKDVV